MFLGKAVYAEVLFNILSVLGENHYYWREYTGKIPTDAVPGGSDINSETTYIGLGFVKNRGIIPGVIYPNQKFISVPSYGVQKVDCYIQVSFNELISF